MVSECPMCYEWVIKAENWFDLVWHNWKCSKNFKMVSNIWRLQDVIMFPLIIGLPEQRVLLKVLNYLLVSHSFGQSIQHFSKSCWLFFSWSYIILSSKNQQSVTFEGIFFGSYFGEQESKIGHFLEVLSFDFPKRSLKRQLFWQLPSHSKFHVL